MGETNRFYHYSINEHQFDTAKAEKSDLHNHRFKLDPADYNPDMTKDNLVYIQGEKVNPENAEENYNSVRQIVDEIKKDFINSANTNLEDEKLSNKEKSQLQTDRTYLRSKIKKWSENPKAEQDEKAFWEKLNNDLGNEKLNGQDLIQELQQFGKSVKRFNDKRRAIEGIDSFNKLLGTTSKNIGLSVVSKELVYKIPDKYNKEITAEHWVKISNAMNKRFFPNFDPIYQAVHMDENGENPHIHTRLSGKNSKSGKFDIQDQLINRLSKINPDFPYKGRKYSSLNEDEIVIFGELYQDEVFKSFNKYLNKLNYDFNVKKKTKNERALESEKFLDSHRPIAQREHNRQNKLKEENQQLICNKKELKNEVDDLQLDKNKLESEVSILQKIKDSLKIDIPILEKAKKSVYSAIDSALKFSKTNLQPEAERYHEEQKVIRDINEDISKAVEKQALAFQPNDEQKRKIKIKRK